jgi:hypothetical protein
LSKNKKEGKIVIEFVLNGYFRSGSTRVWKMLKEGTPEAINLYEPLHPKLFNLIHDKFSGLHGISVWDDYAKVPPRILNQMRLKLKDFTCLFYFEDVEPYLDAINSIEEKVTLQPNRMYFVLKDVAQKYNCKIVHLVRDPADNFLGFVEMFAMYGKNVKEDCDYWVDTVCGFVGCVEEQYNAITKKFDAPKVTKFLDKFLVVWTYCNYYAVDQADDNIMVTNFEDLTEEKGIDRMERFGGIKLKRGLLDKKRIFLADEEFKKMVDERIRNLGLTNMVKTILEAAYQ